MKFEDVERGYANLWARAKLKPEHVSAARAIAKKLAANAPRYRAAAAGAQCPWWFVAAIHELESGASFAHHLHNGDPLTARTVHVPAGRPAAGSPPFTWEQSAADALELAGIASVKDWSVPRALFEWERYNGLGYFQHGVNSPYLWSFTDQYAAGRFVADGEFDASAVSQQCGAAAILRAFIDIGAVEDDTMIDLQDFLKHFVTIAPTLATMAAGPAAGIAVKAIAEAIGPETQSDAAAVKQALDATPLSKITSILSAAESVVQALQPVQQSPAVQPAPAAQQPAPAPIQAPPAASSPLDEILPALTGWKTIIGTILMVLVVGAHDLGLFPGILTDGITHMLETLAGGIIGVGLVAKIDRYVGILTGKTPLPASA